MILPDLDGQPRRIVLTGGPGGGKTTAADLFRREIGERVVVVPEAATLLFSGGFPRYTTPGAARCAQRAIFNVQRALEDTQRARFPDRLLLCDRGTVDGGAYWPEGPEDFFREMGTSLEEELRRYDAVIFFQTAAAGGFDVVEGSNPVRNETSTDALRLDNALRSLWSPHPRSSYVAHRQSFIEKVQVGLNAILAHVAGKRGPEE